MAATPNGALDGAHDNATNGDMNGTANGTVNGATNGEANGHVDEEQHTGRFSYVPSQLELPVDDAEVGTVEIDLEDLDDDPTELCALVEGERMSRKVWTMVAMAHAKHKNIDNAIFIITKGISVQPKNQAQDKLYLYTTLCWLWLFKSRQAPRVPPESSGGEVKTKDHYLREATTTLNDASRINPSFPPLFLARGALCLLRAALLPNQRERLDLLRQASKAFEDSLKTSNNKNMLAYLGRARCRYSMGQYSDALRDYQQVLKYAPDITDPDPRIGIGCCYWQLGHPEDSQTAWKRALELNTDSKAANILLGVCYLHQSYKLASNDPKFRALYAKAMTGYTQAAFKLDNMFPMSCSVFANFFLVRKAYDKVDTLSRRAIELTDVSTIASDGWYARARREHFEGRTSTAADFYQRSDEARGGDERGYPPAKFGVAQMRIAHGDIDGAKFRLDKLVQKTKGDEAMALLGAIYADEVFSGRITAPADVATATTRAISYLEIVRTAWQDPNSRLEYDPIVLLNLSRLYENTQPLRALNCLLDIEKAEIEEFSQEGVPEDPEAAAAWKASVREQLSPQLLNNIACFHFRAERFEDALSAFQTALKACTRLVDEGADDEDTDALVTTISYNLARTYESVNMLDEAKEVIAGLLERHDDYTDAKLRQVLIALKQSPSDEGPKTMKKLFEGHSADLEVRALMGWYTRKAKRLTSNIAEDEEQRHFKRTLQNHDKHDCYALTGMGNLHLKAAREMRRETDAEKESRGRMYARAMEFFDKALSLDPKNAYAAQGVAIAMIETDRNFVGALHILSQVKDTIKDASTSLNLGHVYCELKQYPRAIEAYENALRKKGDDDHHILTCLGRSWLMRGKVEKSAAALATSLEYSKRALEMQPEQIHFKFNIAFVQMQAAQLLLSLPENQRTLAELKQIDIDLDEAIESFSSIAKSPNPPFPRNDIEQRANMGRNTMKKQLDRAIQKQTEYEEANAEKLKRARELREAEQLRRQEEQRKAEEELAAKQAEITKRRAEQAQKDLDYAKRKMEEDRLEKEAREAAGYDSDGKKRRGARGTGPKKTRGSKRKKEDDDFLDDADDDEEGGEAPALGSSSAAASPADTTAVEGDGEKPAKRRKLGRKGAQKPAAKPAKSAKSSKYKSDERIVDSDEDVPAADAAPEDEEMEDAPPTSDAAPSGRRNKRVLDDDDEDEDGQGNESDQAPAPMFGDDDEGDD